jgi:hypothetical protein
MSQSLQLTNKAGVIANGTDIYVWGDTSTAYVNVFCTLKNISSETITVDAKEIPDTLIAGAKIAICFELCSTPQTTAFTSPYTSTLAPNATDNTFEGHYYTYGHLGESVISFVFYNSTNRNDSVGIIVHFNATAAGIKQITPVNTEISNPYPNPAAGFTSINYTLPENTEKARFVLTNILGSKVMETNVTNEGKLNLNTSNMQSGVYFYSFFVNDKLTQTKKLIIQH